MATDTKVVATRDFRRPDLSMQTGEVQRIPPDLAELLIKIGCCKRHRSNKEAA